MLWNLKQIVLFYVTKPKSYDLKKVFFFKKFHSYYAITFNQARLERRETDSKFNQLFFQDFSALNSTISFVEDPSCHKSNIIIVSSSIGLKTIHEGNKKIVFMFLPATTQLKQSSNKTNETLKEGEKGCGNRAGTVMLNIWFLYKYFMYELNANKSVTYFYVSLNIIWARTLIERRNDGDANVKSIFYV